MKLILFIFVNLIILRTASHLFSKAKQDDPFEGYKSEKEFYMKEILFGIFLSPAIGSSGFILKKTPIHKIMRLYLIINILTFLSYLLIIIAVLFAIYIKQR